MLLCFSGLFRDTINAGGSLAGLPPYLILLDLLTVAGKSRRLEVSKRHLVPANITPSQRVGALCICRYSAVRNPKPQNLKLSSRVSTVPIPEGEGWYLPLANTVP